MIIILNGPAGSGKDTISDLLVEMYPDETDTHSFKAPIWEIAKATLGDKFDKFCVDYFNRETKEKPFNGLNGMSPRDFFIHISEAYCKPAFGQEFFGERVLDAVRNSEKHVVISDGGFPLELFPMLKAGMQVVVVRLHRKLYTFDGDSRNYLYEEYFESLPIHVRPRFIDVEVVEGYPEDAAIVISRKVLGK